MDKLITVGKITKNQGNRGEVRILSQVDNPDLFRELEFVFTDQENDNIPPQKRKIENIWFHKKFIIAKFAGIENIEDALELKNCLVKIPESDLPALPEDEFYINDLLGISVVTDSGKFLGWIKEIWETGGADIMLVSGDEGEYMIPVAHQFIKEINFEKEYIIITPISGLLDL